MIHQLVDLKADPETDSLLDHMRTAMVDGTATVSLLGNRLYVQWMERGYCRTARLVILDVDDGEEANEA